MSNNCFGCMEWHQCTPRVDAACFGDQPGLVQAVVLSMIVLMAAEGACVCEESCGIAYYAVFGRCCMVVSLVRVYSKLDAGYDSVDGCDMRLVCEDLLSIMFVFFKSVFGIFAYPCGVYTGVFCFHPTFCYLDIGCVLVPLYFFMRHMNTLWFLPILYGCFILVFGFLFN